MKNKGFLDKCIDFLKDILINIIVEFVLKYPVIGILIALLFVLLMCLKEITKGCEVLGAYVAIAIIYYIVLRYKTKQEYNKFVNNYVSNISLPSDDIKRVKKAISEMQMTNVREGIFFLNCLVFSILGNKINGFTAGFYRKNTDKLKIVLWFKSTKKNVEKIKINVSMNGKLKQLEDKSKDITYYLNPQQVGKVEISYHNTLVSQLHDGKNLLTIFANGRKIVSVYIYILS